MPRKETPKVGDVVYYAAYGSADGTFPAGEERAAIVTQVHERGEDQHYPDLGLCVLNPTGMYFNLSIPYSEYYGTGGTWHHR